MSGIKSSIINVNNNINTQHLNSATVSDLENNIVRIVIIPTNILIALNKYIFTFPLSLNFVFFIEFFAPLFFPVLQLITKCLII